MKTDKQQKCSCWFNMKRIYKCFFYQVFLLFLVPTCVMAQEKKEAWTLRECIDHARERNIQVEYARVSYKHSLVELARAKAQKLPSLDFSSTQGWGHQKKADAEGTLTSASAYTGNYALNGNMAFYNGSKLTRGINQQELTGQAREQEVFVSQNDIEIAVAKAYLQILYANETLKTDRQTLENSESQLNRSKALQEAGSISMSDYVQLEAQYTSDRYRVVQSENDLAFSKLQLKQLLELEPETVFEVDFPRLEEQEVMALVPSLEVVYREALRGMPEMKSRKLSVEAARLGEKIAWGDHLPSVALNASVTTNHDSKASDAYFSQMNDRLTENVGINISIPIANRKQARLNVSKAKLQTAQAQIDEVNTRKELLQTVESLQQDVISAQSRYTAATQNVKSAYASYQLVEEEFNVGIKNTVELLVEKNNYLSALQEQIQAKYQAVLALKLLKFYQGESIDI